MRSLLRGRGSLQVTGLQHDDQGVKTNHKNICRQRIALANARPQPRPHSTARETCLGGRDDIALGLKQLDVVFEKLVQLAARGR